jgi:hypothetical protein
MGLDMVCKAVVSIPLARGEVHRLSCEDGSEPLLVSVKDREFFKYPNYCLFVRNHSGPWV